MRASALITLLLLTIGSASAQKSWEFGLLAGTSYYSGDLNERGHFKRGLMHQAYGAVLRRNWNARWSMRYQAVFAKVSGDDRLWDNAFQNARNLHFRSNIYEGSAQVEFNFFEYVASDGRNYFTPTVFWGMGMFWMNPEARIGDTEEYRELRYQRNEGQLKEYSRLQPCMPFGVGFRAKFHPRLLMSAEWGFRKTWTDYMDDVSTTYPGRAAGNVIDGSTTTAGFQRGNSETKDWYSFAGINLTYRFGHKPDACWFERIGSRKKRTRSRSNVRNRKGLRHKVTN